VARPRRAARGNALVCWRSSLPRMLPMHVQTCRWRFEDVLNNSHFAECVVRHVLEVARLFASADICSGSRWLACLSRGPSVRTWTLAAAGAAAAKAGLLGFQQTLVAALNVFTWILHSAAVALNQCKGAASPQSRTCVASRSAPRRRGIRRHLYNTLLALWLRSSWVHWHPEPGWFCTVGQIVPDNCTFD
jgi:hypothetical protein